MLLNSIEQVKAYNSAVQSTLNFNSIVSFRDDAEDTVIVPLIGRPFYNQLLNRIADAVNNPLTTDEAELIRLLTKAAANFTIAFYISFGSVQLSDSGAHVAVAESLRIASDKKLNELKNQSFINGYTALYNALEFLHSNKSKTEFAVYFGSTAYDKNCEPFLQYPSDYSRIEQVNKNAWLFNNLISAQLKVADTDIKPLLGDALYNEIKTKIKEQDTSPLQIELINKIKTAVSYLSMAEGIALNLLKVDVNGVFSISESTGGITGNFQMKESPSDRRLQKFMHQFITRGESELEKLRIWLNANQTEIPEYTTQTIAALSPVNLNSDDLPFFFT